MSLSLGMPFPNSMVKTTIGKTKIFDYQGHDTALIFVSVPEAFEEISNKEMENLIVLLPEFEKRSVKIIVMTCDSMTVIEKWLLELKKRTGLEGDFPFPMISDEERTLLSRLGIGDSSVHKENGEALPCRSVFIIDKKRLMRFSAFYPVNIQRDFNEILRAVDGLALHDDFKIVTPANWVKGHRVIVPPSADASKYPNPVEVVDLPSRKPYLRFTDL